MVPANVSFTVYQGADFSECIYLKDAQVPPQPIDFPYTKARLQIREDYGLPVILELSETDGITLTHAEGKIQIDIDAIKSEALNLFGDAQVYRFDLVCSDNGVGAAQIVDRVAQGFMVFWPEISRAPVVT